MDSNRPRDRYSFRRLLTFRCWLGVTALLVLAGVGLFLAIIISAGVQLDWFTEEMSGEAGVLAMVLILIVFAPTATALGAGVVGWFSPRLGALIATVIPLSVFFWILVLNGSVRDDPALLIAIVPAVGYLLLCLSVVAFIHRDRSNQQAPHLATAASAPRTDLGTEPVIFPSEPPYGS